MSRPVLPVLFLALASAIVACGDDEPTTIPTGPTAPTTVTVTFTGTVNPNGAETNPFPTDGGTITVTINSLSPDSAAVVGLTLGTWNGSACQSVISNDRATQGTTVIGTASGSGNLCVRVFDATGQLAGPTAYEVQVVHPQR